MTAKSYSQVSLYEKCPRQWKLRYIDRFPVDREKSSAAARGTMIHESVEKFLLGEADEVHPEIAQWQGWLQELRDEPDGVHAEFQFCLDEEWNPVPWDSEDGHIRGYIDTVYLEIDNNEGTVYEYKTGRKYPEHALQMELYSTVVLEMFEALEKVTAYPVYFDGKDTDSVPVEFTRDRQGTRKYLWSSRINRIDKDKYYAARPGMYCRWCDFSKSNGGPCEFGG